MKRFLILLVTLCAGVVAAQEQSPLDKAYDEMLAAEQALKAAEAKREQSAEPQPGERSGTAGGYSRLNESYFARQQALDKQVEDARKSYDEALKRWNDLK